MSPPVQPIPATPDQSAEPTPDFTRLDRAAALMRRLSSVGPSHDAYNEAQTLFESARQEYLKEAKQHHDFFAQLAKNQAVESPDLGASASARIGVAQGLGGLGGGLLGGAGAGALLGSVIPGPGTAIGGALGGLAGALGGSAAVKPLTEMFSSAPAEDVRRQWAATVGEHPDAHLAGEVGASLFGGAALITASKLATGMNLAGEKLAQAQMQSKMMAQKLVDLEGKMTASAVAGKPTEEAAVRAYLAKQNYPPEAIESVIKNAQSRGLMGNLAKTAADATKAQVPGTMGPIGKDPLETATIIRQGGVTAQGGATPYSYPITGVKELDAAIEAPVPTAGAAPSSDPLQFSPQLQKLRSTMQDVKGRLGRNLTPAETEKVREMILGPARPSPGHPIFYGQQAPTQ